MHIYYYIINEEMRDQNYPASSAALFCDLLCSPAISPSLVFISFSLFSAIFVSFFRFFLSSIFSLPRKFYFKKYKKLKKLQQEGTNRLSHYVTFVGQR